jgi:DNA mismatch repair protein MutS2
MFDLLLNIKVKNNFESCNFGKKYILIYPPNFEQKIGFDLIRSSLRELCLSPLGAAIVDRIHFSDNLNNLTKLLEQTEEFRRILLSSENFPSEHFYDVTETLTNAAIEGTYIPQDTLFDLKRSLQTVADCMMFFKKTQEGLYPQLNEIISSVYLDKSILQRLDAILDDKGKIRDSASDELLKIRKEMISKQSSVNKRISQVIQTVKKQGWAPEDIELTIRNGRVVIPMLAAYKRNIKGFVHDESATGHTVFIEPADVFEMNNDLRELENAEKREIVKILFSFTASIRPSIEELKKCFYFLGLMDFIRAKARFALHTDSFKPTLRDIQHFNWYNAVHPLLYLNHKAQKKIVVPLNISLDEVSRILIISGPNAGGKSVCLKTVGLLQYMLQCGLLVPMKEFSEAGIFENIFIDIGDEQSLENDLSTYSSHLLNMRHFICNANEKTLFLIDEFGTGTEPQLGGAIAEAILEKLNEKKSFGVITTHYSNLKLLADKEPGISNGAMLFDSEKMKPLYMLQTGKPGSSFAFEIAETIGLQKDVLKHAKEKAGIKQLSFDKQLQNLDTQKSELDKKETQLRVADDFLSEIIDKYQKLTEDLENSKKEIIARAKEEAKNLLDETNRIIENTIREIRENQADKEKTKDIRKNLLVFSEGIKVEKSMQSAVPIPIGSKQSANQKKKNKEINPEVKILNTPIEKGDYVRIIGQETIGEVIGIDAKEVFIVFGTSQLKTKLNKLEKVSKEDYKTQSDKNKHQGKRPSIDLNEKIKNFKMNIDLRGMRVEEALSAVQHFMDDALLLSVPEVRILHGKGNGVLRHLVHQYLRTIPEVKHFGDEELEKGGHGITVVSFK